LCVAQNTPIFKAESHSAIVWGTDLPNGATASVVKDPLTGSTIERMSFQGVDVSSTDGISKRPTLAWGPPYALTVWITVVNNTDVPIDVGGFKSTLRQIESKNLKKARIRCNDDSPSPSGAIAPGAGQRFAAVLELLEPGPPPAVRYSVRVGGRDWVFVWGMHGFEYEHKISMPNGCNLVSHN
jgi:hypothetical protein